MNVASITFQRKWKIHIPSLRTSTKFTPTSNILFYSSMSCLRFTEVGECNPLRTYVGQDCFRTLLGERSTFLLNADLLPFEPAYIGVLGAHHTFDLLCAAVTNIKSFLLKTTSEFNTVYAELPGYSASTAVCSFVVTWVFRREFPRNLWEKFISIKKMMIPSERKNANWAWIDGTDWFHASD